MNMIKGLLAPDGEYSSKRAAGLAGLATIFICFIYCCVTGKQMPDVTEFLAGACVTLLGIDPVVGLWKNVQSQSTETTKQE